MEEVVPEELFEDDPADRERALRVGKFLILEEMGYFGSHTNVKLAKGKYKGSFNAGVRRAFSGVYGDTVGCDAADLEIAAQMLGVFEIVYETPLDEPER